ncbi:Arc family DNA-binding protein [Rhizobium rhizogenes]|uniref:Arc family DNA-binding protein n=1 Tax=Rhizobium rhizogenes TaxID=359 RepID=UPI0024BE6F89|nr:Arc family DNA-binding protein [Rhizobium rhizogenes]MDJ1632502.1 Arc family DNA-binding protein [Rhizobium rhizogenes]
MGPNRTNTDQYQLRLPPGLRERIKAAADRNSRSMNAEIVRALEIAFPEPVSVGARLGDLGILFSALRKVRGYDAAVEALTDEVLDIIGAGASGRDPTLNDETIAELHKALLKWGGQREVELAARKRVVDEKYKSAGENE